MTKLTEHKTEIFNHISDLSQYRDQIISRIRQPKSAAKEVEINYKWKKCEITGWLLDILQIHPSEAHDVKYIYRKGYRNYIMCHTDGTYSTDYVFCVSLGQAFQSINYKF